VVWAEAVTPDGRFVLKASKRNHQAWYQPRSAGDSNLVERARVLVQRTTAKEQRRRLIATDMPETLLTRCGQVAIENHLNMVRPIKRKPEVSRSTLAAFLMTETADRVFRCINASVAVSASELAAMPLPTAAETNHAMRQPDPDRVLRQIYGL
jgi:adenine-specific DNA-methyltransferase